MLEIIFVICLILVALTVRHYRIRKQHPPGPLGFPFLGQLPFIIIQIFLSKIIPTITDRKHFDQMKKKYGDIWSFEIGRQKLISLSSIDVITEAFVENGRLFSGRPKLESYKIICANRGIVFIDGDLWQENRVLAIKALRDLGMGKRNLENDICEESHELIEYIESKSSKPIGSPDIFVKPTSNVISKLAFNERNTYDDPELTHYLENIKNVMSSQVGQKFIDLFPNLCQLKIMRKTFPPICKFINGNVECMRFIAERCRSRIKIENLDSRPSCVFDYFWRYRFQDYPDKTYDEKFLDISYAMYDLYNAGIDTTTNMFGFSCLFLGQYQDLQKELRKEIHSQADDHKLINMNMRKDCPRLLSFIDEVQRYCSLVHNVYHQAIESCVIAGYKIEQNDIAIGDLGSILHDPKLFPDPDTFNPHRFLDKSGTKYIPNKSLIPFGIGKRACLGESIALMELYLFLSKIIHRFEIILSKETNDKIDEIIEGNSGLVHSPLNHEIIFKPIDLNK